MTASDGTLPLLHVRHLRAVFRNGSSLIPAVDDVSFTLGRGETLGLVGESGCGKSTVALSLLKLLPAGGHIVGGRILFEDVDLLGLPDEELRRVRGRRIGMIFQEPSAALNPVLRIGVQLTEATRTHLGFSRQKAREETRARLAEVGLADPDSCMEAYPDQLSGGMRQRVLIAMALSCGPRLLIGDEPTTALDVTTQAQILDLLRRLKTRHGLSVLLISHDWGVIAAMADRVLVMYAGQIIESGPLETVLNRAGHPYTQALLRAVPRLKAAVRKRLPVIEGAVPKLDDLPPGCRFHPRCPEMVEECRSRHPALLRTERQQEVRCLLRSPLGDAGEQ